MEQFQRWWWLAAVLLLGLLTHLLEPILTPFLVGALLAYLGDPLVDRLETWRINRSLAVCLVFVAMLILFVIVVVLMVPLLGRQWQSLLKRLPELIAMVQQWLPVLQSRFDLPPIHLPIEDLQSSLSAHWREAGNVLLLVVRYISQSSVGLLAVIANLFLIPVVTFYLLRDWDVLMGLVRDVLPRSWEPVAVKLANECDEVLSAFLRGQMLVMMSLGAVYSVGLIIVGLEAALLLGVLAGLASVVPYMGFVVGIGAAGVAAYIQFHEWLPLLYVAMVFGVGQMLEGTVLTPLLVGDKIGLHPVAVIFAIMAGAQLMGFVGILLALPLAAIIMVLLRHIHDQYKNSDWYGQSADQTSEGEG